MFFNHGFTRIVTDRVWFFNTEAQRSGGRLGRGLARPVAARSLAAFRA